MQVSVSKAPPSPVLAMFDEEAAPPVVASPCCVPMPPAIASRDSIRARHAGVWPSEERTPIRHRSQFIVRPKRSTIASVMYVVRRFRASGCPSVARVSASPVRFL